MFFKKHKIDNESKIKKLEQDIETLANALNVLYGSVVSLRNYLDVTLYLLFVNDVIKKEEFTVLTQKANLANAISEQTMVNTIASMKAEADDGGVAKKRGFLKPIIGEA